MEEVKGILTRSVLARSILGAEISVYTVGYGKKAVLYVGGVRGNEALLSDALAEFLTRIVALYERGSVAYGYAVREVLAARRIVVVPCLNPDGISYAREGVSPDNPLAERVQAICGDEEMSLWRANARGVALDKNFAAGHRLALEKAWAAGVCGAHVALWCGEYPESEPESAALARLARSIGEDLLGALELSLGAGEILASCAEKLSAKTGAAGRILARNTGLPLRSPTETPPSGGFFDWCLEELNRPAYRVSLKNPDTEDDAKAKMLLFEQLARALFGFPFMV
ncbi:MAG: hypothetical protein IJC99_04460 [Clostridia bacterium]|nr:hypothetical protein [Clostridia bacterium]